MFRNRPLLFLLIAALLGTAFLARLAALPPAWWSDPATRALDPNSQPDNYAPANLGQLKNFAAQAKKHLDQQLSALGGAGPAIDNLVAGFQKNTPDNFAPANLGQLKAVAKPFYDRLIAVGVDTRAALIARGYPAGWAYAYPWDPDAPWNKATPQGQQVDKTVNFAPANLGQLKIVFSFDLAKDSDSDGIPDWWESHYGLNPNNPADASQTGSGGMTNLHHFVNGSAPDAPAPTGNIIPGTPSLDQDASQSIYPPGGAGSLLKNGDFSQPPVTDHNNTWQVFPGRPGWVGGLPIIGAFGDAIPGWTAISGILIELQKQGDNQICELDSHWQTADHTVPTDHGIQQVVALKRGTYILAFDYKGRTHGNPQQTAGDFTVHVQGGWNAAPTEIIRKMGAVPQWKRAITTFNIQGGVENGSYIPVILKFDIADAADSFGTLIDNVVLLPVEFKTYPDAELGPDKAHKRNLPHLAGYDAYYGKEWGKCVSKVWETSHKLNLIDYLKGADDPSMRTLFEQNLKWKVDGVEQASHEVDYGMEPGENLHIHRFVEVLLKSGGETIDRLIITVVPRSTKTKWDAWYPAEKADLAWLAALPQMFSWIEKTVGTDGFLPRPDRNFNPFLYNIPHPINTFYHPGAAYEMRGFPTGNKNAHQVCYDSDGVLVVSGVKAGSADKVMAWAPPIQFSTDGHRDADVKPFVWAAQLDGNPVQGAGFPEYIDLDRPMLFEGGYIGKYLEVRPPVPNNKPRLVPGAMP